MKLPIKLPNKVTQFIGKTMLRAKKASPEVCVVSGIICGGAAIVMVGVKTWKKKDTLKKDYDSIKAVTTTEKTDENGEKSIEKIPYKELVEDDKKLLWSYRKTFAGDIIKTYWIPTVLGIGSVGLIWGGRTMLRRELSAVTSAYALLMESYKQYRQRVIDDVGIEKDQEYMHGIKMADAVDEETGEYYVFAEKVVCEEVENSLLEISLEEARKVYPNCQLGDTVRLAPGSKEFSRIATQNAKNVLPFSSGRP